MNKIDLRRARKLFGIVAIPIIEIVITPDNTLKEVINQDRIRILDNNMRRIGIFFTS